MYQSPSQPSDPSRTVRFDGRILFLSQNASVIERQLLGEDVRLEEAVPLRTDISTDEITPAYICYYFDEKLGEYPYLGLDCAGIRPVKQGSVKPARFAVTVAGRRYGKGSSREARAPATAAWKLGFTIRDATALSAPARESPPRMKV